MTQPRSIDSLGVASTIAAARRTGRLAELVRGRGTAGGLAERLGLAPRAVALVLDVLAAEDLAARDGDGFVAGPRLAALAQQPGGFELSLGMWMHTETFLRSGEPYVMMDRSPAEREAIYRSVVSGLGVLFDAAASELAGRLPVRPVRILDVGCGSGVWSLAIAERVPEARVTGLDLPAVLASFTARAAERKLADRVATIPNDMHAAELPAGGFDLAVIANVVRLELPERAASLVRRVASAVAPGGAMLVIDALAEGTPAKDHARALYALHLGLRTREGQVHSPQAISGWLTDAGFSTIETIEVAAGAGAIGGLLARRP